MFPKKYSKPYCTPLKTNMSPENQWLEDVFPTKIVPFWGTCCFSGVYPTFGCQLPKPRKFTHLGSGLHRWCPAYGWYKNGRSDFSQPSKIKKRYLLQYIKKIKHSHIQTTKGNACQSQILDLLILYLSFLEAFLSKKYRTCYVFWRWFLSLTSSSTIWNIPPVALHHKGNLRHWRNVLRQSQAACYKGRIFSHGCVSSVTKNKVNFKNCPAISSLDSGSLMFHHYMEFQGHCPQHVHWFSVEGLKHSSWQSQWYLNIPIVHFKQWMSGFGPLGFHSKISGGPLVIYTTYNISTTIQLSVYLNG